MDRSVCLRSILVAARDVVVTGPCVSFSISALMPAVLDWSRKTRSQDDAGELDNTVSSTVAYCEYTVYDPLLSLLIPIIYSKSQNILLPFFKQKLFSRNFILFYFPPEYSLSRLLSPLTLQAVV